MFAKFLLFVNLLVAVTAAPSPQTSKVPAFQPKIPTGRYEFIPQDGSGASVASGKSGEPLVATQWTRGAAGGLRFDVAIVGRVRETGEELYTVKAVGDSDPAMPLRVKDVGRSAVVVAGPKGKAPTKWHFRYLKQDDVERNCFQIIDYLTGGRAWTTNDVGMNKTDPHAEPRITLAGPNATDSAQHFCLKSEDPGF